MFTGLIEEVGEVRSVLRGKKSAQIVIRGSKVLEGITVGDSVSTNGVCLTVVNFVKDTLTVDVMPETMRRSNLKFLQSHGKVNLERALKMCDRLGGHLVSGHIDGIGVVEAITHEENATWITIGASEKILRYVIEKGSIALDGTSLTVAEVNEDNFKVSIIPLTRIKTILLSKKIGDFINIECDMIGKYIEKFMVPKERKEKSSFNLDFLKANGFLSDS